MQINVANWVILLVLNGLSSNIRDFRRVLKRISAVGTTIIPPTNVIPISVKSMCYKWQSGLVNVLKIFSAP